MEGFNQDKKAFLPACSQCGQGQPEQQRVHKKQGLGEISACVKTAWAAEKRAGVSSCKKLSTVDLCSVPCDCNALPLVSSAPGVEAGVWYYNLTEHTPHGASVSACVLRQQFPSDNLIERCCGRGAGLDSKKDELCAQLHNIHSGPAL